MTTLDILKQAKAAKSELAKLGSEGKQSVVLVFFGLLKLNKRKLQRNFWNTDFICFYVLLSTSTKLFLCWLIFKFH